MNRWLVLPIGLGVAAAAGWILLSSSTGKRDSRQTAPHAEIGEQSREQLREILRQADEDDR